VEATLRLMRSNFTGPVNIGSEEMVTINQLAQMAIEHSGKTLGLKHIEGPQGVRGRNSDNALYQEKMGWDPKFSLRAGIGLTYDWIGTQLAQREKAGF